MHRLLVSSRAMTTSGSFVWLSWPATTLGAYRRSSSATICRCWLRPRRSASSQTECSSPRYGGKVVAPQSEGYPWGLESISICPPLDVSGQNFPR